jgi:hypothetical protein
MSSACSLALVLAFCVASPAYAQSSSKQSNETKSANTSKTNSSQNLASSQSQQKMQASKKAVHALRLVSQARQALIDKNQSKAKTDVDQALNLLKQVPQTTTNTATGVVPIYAELEQTTFIGPVLTAKKQTQNSQQMASNSSPNTTNSSNNQSQSSTSSDTSALPQSDQPVSNQPQVVKWVEGGFSYIGLDINQARQHLQAAQQDLQNNDTGKADLELARVQESVDTGSIDTNMPLVRARENLSLARDDAQSGKTSQVKADLTAAANSLNSYAQNSQAPHAQDAKNLMQQIKSSAASISTNKTNASQKIDSWWNQLADWTGQKTS